VTSNNRTFRRHRSVRFLCGIRARCCQFRWVVEFSWSPAKHGSAFFSELRSRPSLKRLEPSFVKISKPLQGEAGGFAVESEGGAHYCCATHHFSSMWRMAPKTCSTRALGVEIRRLRCVYLPEIVLALRCPGFVRASDSVAATSQGIAPGCARLCTVVDNRIKLSEKMCDPSKATAVRALLDVVR
jgi:hypothetical protein